jgi:molecular chaperone IbpA
MNTVDLSPLYRSSIGFDRFASLINHALASEHSNAAYPPYNIESKADNQYAISLAVAGFSQEELDIQVEKGVLTIRGNKTSKDTANYLYQGIANRSFERKFNLADYVEVREAELSNGLLTIHLVKELPEAMKPQTIAINQSSSAIEHKAEQLDSNDDKAA